MRICKNRRSGKYFVFIDYVNGDHILAITPKNEIKELEGHLFEDPIEKDEVAFLCDGIVTKSQVETYRRHEENRKQDASENLEIMVEEMTPYEQQLLLEALERRQERRPQVLSGD